MFTVLCFIASLLLLLCILCRAAKLHIIWNPVRHYMRQRNAVQDFKKQPIMFSGVDICSGHWEKTGRTQECFMSPLR